MSDPLTVQEHQRPQSSAITNADRLRPPVDRPKDSSRLKFNPPTSRVKIDGSNEKDKTTKKTDSSRMGTGRRSEVDTKRSTGVATQVDESKKAVSTSAAAQKAACSRLAQNNKQLFRKQSNANPRQLENKSVETKEPKQNVQKAPTNDLVRSAVASSEQVKAAGQVLSSDDGGPAQSALQLDCSMYDERNDSFIDKNSIAEFEMLEKECF